MTGEKDYLNPDEIDALLNAPKDDSDAGEESPPREPTAASKAQHTSGSNDDDDAAGRPLDEEESDPEQTLDDAEAHLEEALSGSIHMPDPTAVFGEPSAFDLEPFDGGRPERRTKQPLDILQDVELDLRIELGRTELLIEEVVQLKEGSVVPLDKLAGDPVDILVNGRLIARGEVLVLNDNFCVRVAEILTPHG